MVTVIFYFNSNNSYVKTGLCLFLMSGLVILAVLLQKEMMCFLMLLIKSLLIMVMMGLILICLGGVGVLV